MDSVEPARLDLSPHSICYRYFSPRPHLSDRDLDRFTNVDYVDRFALAARAARRATTATTCW